MLSNHVVPAHVREHLMITYQALWDKKRIWCFAHQNHHRTVHKLRSLPPSITDYALFLLILIFFHIPFVTLGLILALLFFQHFDQFRGHLFLKSLFNLPFFYSESCPAALHALISTIWWATSPFNCFMIWRWKRLYTFAGPDGNIREAMLGIRWQNLDLGGASGSTSILATNGIFISYFLL